MEKWNSRRQFKSTHWHVRVFTFLKSKSREKMSKTREKLSFRDLQKLISTLSIFPLAAEIGLWCEVTRGWKKKTISKSKHNDLFPSPVIDKEKKSALLLDYWTKLLNHFKREKEFKHSFVSKAIPLLQRSIVLECALHEFTKSNRL